MSIEDKNTGSDESRAQNETELLLLQMHRQGVIRQAAKPSTITVDQCLHLAGLLLMANRHMDAIEEVIDEMTSIMQTAEDDSTVSDWVWGGARSILGLLKESNITVDGISDSMIII